MFIYSHLFSFCLLCAATGCLLYQMSAQPAIDELQIDKVGDESSASKELSLYGQQRTGVRRDLYLTEGPLCRHAYYTAAHAEMQWDPTSHAFLESLTDLNGSLEDSSATVVWKSPQGTCSYRPLTLKMESPFFEKTGRSPQMPTIACRAKSALWRMDPNLNVPWTLEANGLFLQVNPL